MAFVIGIQPTAIFSGPESAGFESESACCSLQCGDDWMGVEACLSPLVERPKMNQTGVCAVAMWLASPPDGISRSLRFVAERRP